MVLEKAIPSGFALTGLSQVAPLYIIPDNRDIAVTLAKKLEQLGIEIQITAHPPKTAKSIICLLGLNHLNHQDEEIELNYKLFEIAHEYSHNFMESQGLFLIAQDMGGRLGFSEIQAPYQGGIAALAKTSAQEWPQTGVKVIDIASSLITKEEIANNLFQEIISGSSDIEIAWNSQGRFKTSIVTSSAGIQQIVLTKNAVVLVSGGARGVTASCLLALAEQFDSLKIAILGRTPLTEEPVFLKDCETERQLQSALSKKYKDDHQPVIPKVIQSQVQQIIVLREVKKNLLQLQEKAEVSYFTADITDLDQVQQVVKQIHQQWGNIDVVIHAAGIIHDKLIHHKEVTQFHQVFDTKVLGFKNILKATETDSLTHICCFSSVAGCMGNAGQVDYAMANNVLNKVCQEQSKIRNNCVVKSINWGPWQGGMVSPDLFKHFAKRGIPLIPLAEGARFFAQEITCPSPVEVIYGGNYLPQQSLTQSHWIWLHQSVYPSLDSHKIQGIPVVPIVLVHEWFLRLAYTMYPDKKVIASKNLKVLKGILLDHFYQQGEWLEIYCQCLEQEDCIDLQMELRRGNTLCYKCTLTMTNDTHLQIAKPELSFTPWNLPDAQIYEKLFHGPDFACIEKTLGISENACTAILHPSLQLEENYRSEITILDGGLQLPTLFTLDKYGRDVLPTGFGFMALDERRLFKGQIQCEAHRSSYHELHSIWDIYYVQKSRVIGVIKDLSFHAYSGNKNE